MVFQKDQTSSWDFDRLEKEVSGQKNRFDHVIHLLYSHDRPLGTLLDAGAGTGLLARRLLEKKYPSPLMNCDINPVFVERMKAMNLSAVKADINDLPFKDREFDIVTACEVLEHVVDPGRALSECLRIAKNRVIITLPKNRCEDIYHGWKIQALLVDEWVVMEFERRENP